MVLGNTESSASKKYFRSIWQFKWGEFWELWAFWRIVVRELHCRAPFPLSLISYSFPPLRHFVLYGNRGSPCKESRLGRRLHLAVLYVIYVIYVRLFYVIYGTHVRKHAPRTGTHMRTIGVRTWTFFSIILRNEREIAAVLSSILLRKNAECAKINFRTTRKLEGKVERHTGYTGFTRYQYRYFKSPADSVVYSYGKRKLAATHCIANWLAY